MGFARANGFRLTQRNLSSRENANPEAARTETTARNVTSPTLIGLPISVERFINFSLVPLPRTSFPPVFPLHLGQLRSHSRWLYVERFNTLKNSPCPGETKIYAVCDAPGLRVASRSK